MATILTSSIFSGKYDKNIKLVSVKDENGNI